MTAADERKCPDCGGSLYRIKLLHKGDSTFWDYLEYTLPEAKRSLWTGRFPVEGVVVAFMCDQCARIVLYGTATHLE